MSRLDLGEPRVPRAGSSVNVTAVINRRHAVGQLARRVKKWSVENGNADILKRESSSHVQQTNPLSYFPRELNEIFQTTMLPNQLYIRSFLI